MYNTCLEGNKIEKNPIEGKKSTLKMLILLTQVPQLQHPITIF